MSRNLHFQKLRTWKEAKKWVSFKPVEPKYTNKLKLQSIEIFVRDHKQRDLPIGERSLEAHYGDFVLSQTQGPEAQARRLALDTGYGREPRAILIASHEARVYERGPEHEADDIDPSMLAVVLWHDAGMFFLVASDKLSTATLIRIAESLY